MNCYLISYQGKRYATTADSMAEAETQFMFEYIYEYKDEDFKINQVELSSIEHEPRIIWF